MTNMAPNIDDIQVLVVIQVFLLLCVLGQRLGVNEALFSVIESKARM